MKNEKEHVPVRVIAEAAQGYEGNETLAVLLVTAAAFGGADLIKFQLVYADELATSSYRYYDLFQKLEMPRSSWDKVASAAQQRGLGLVFDVFGPKSLALARELGARMVKIHTTDFFNRSLMREALQTFDTVLLSAGGIDLEAVDALLTENQSGAHKLVLMAGFQAEPTPLGSNNLARLIAIRSRFPDLPLGFMDHAEASSDESTWLGVLAIPCGVSIVEKHITLDHSLQLEDSISALNSEQFRLYVDRIRAAELAMGSADLELTAEERGYGGRALKVLIAGRSLKAGSTITPEDVRLLRTDLNEGERPLRDPQALSGRRLRRDIAEGQVLTEDCI